MSRGVAVVINGEKLRKEFEARKLKMCYVSEECGFEKSYFSKCARENKIGKPAIALLDRMYNIRLDDYDVEDETRTESINTTEPVLTEEVSKALYDIIYSSVYEAVKKALSE